MSILLLFLMISFTPYLFLQCGKSYSFPYGGRMGRGFFCLNKMAWKLSSMKYNVIIWIICLLISSSLLAYGQGDKKFIRQGNSKYEKKEFADSEISYRKAIDMNKSSGDASFNLGDALFKQNKYEEAVKQFIENVKISEDNSKKSNSFYNLGNSLLKESKIQESIDAYKASLKLNPRNQETKYNLAYAQDLLKQQQQQQQDKNKQDQNKEDKEDKKDNKRNKDNNKNDQNKDQNKNQDNKQNQDQNQQQKQQQQQQGISKEDAKRLLDALASDEKNVQEKVKLAKASRERVNTLKNW